MDCLLSAAQTNVALHKPVWQSSDYYTWKAELAVDGSADPDFFQDSCSHTEADKMPWWTVDLEREYTVEYVVITNRGDCEECGELSGAKTEKEFLIQKGFFPDGSREPLGIPTP